MTLVRTLYGYRVRDTLSTIVRPLCNDNARALNFSFVPG